MEEQNQEVPVAQEAPVTGDISVDRKALYRMLNAMVKGQSQVYAGYGGIVHFKQLFGCMDYPECEAKWQEIKNFLEKEPW
jgi:hypothetical protein